MSVMEKNETNVGHWRALPAVSMGHQISAWVRKELRLCPYVVAVGLLAAAFLKTHALATDSVLGIRFWNSRWFLIGLVLVECGYGLWLLFGLYPRWSRVGALCLFF